MAVTIVNGGPLEFDALIKDSQFEATYNQILKQLQTLTQAAKDEGKAVEGYFQKVTQAIAAYASFSVASNFISDVVRVRGEFQQLEVAFSTMLGSKEKADRLLAQATDLAAKTPFTLSDVGTGAKQLLAYGFSAEEVTNTLRRLGDVAAGVGAPLNDIVYLYGTTRTQGRLYAQDLMQFTSRGIPIIAELAKQFKVTDGEVKKLVEAGKIGFPEVEKVIKSLTSTGGMFFNLMEEQSKTLTGQISNLEDAWDNMLNEIGKQNQGTISSAIAAAALLVENYEKVLDILKVLVITYGSYRAAIIATNTVTAISTSLAKGYTVAELLRFHAMVLSERAMKLLNATMLSNPAVAITTAIAGLTAALFIFGKTAGDVKNKTQLLNEAQSKIGNGLAEQEAKIQSYVAVLKQGNVTEAQRLDIYNKLKEISPDLVKGLDAQTLSYDALRDNVEKYTEALRKQYALQANEEAIKASIQQERLIEKQIKAAEKLQGFAASQRGRASNPNMFAPGLQGVSERSERDNLERLRKQLEEQRKVTQELATDAANQSKTQEGAVQAAKKRTVDVIEAEIKALKEERDRVSTVSKEYKEFEKRIAALNKELEAITGKAASKASTRAENELKKLLEAIEDAERRAVQSGLLKEESEIDRINQRYDDLKKKVEELKADPTLKKSLLTRIQNARQTEVGNERIRNEVNEYQKSIEAQREIFEQFEKAKKEIGIENAKAMFAEQTKGFDSFLDYLEAEGERFLAIRNTVLGQLSLFALGSLYTKERAESAKRQAEDEIKRLSTVLKNTMSFNAQRKKLEEEYEKDLAALRKHYKGNDLKEREQALKESHEQEVTDLKNSAIRQTGIYKKLNEDIISFTRQQLKERVKELKKVLESDVSLTPAMKADIQSTIDSLNALLRDTSDENKVAKGLSQAAGFASSLSDGMRSFADAVRDSNKELADTLDLASDILGIASSGLSAGAAALAGDIQGAVSGAIDYYKNVFDFVFTAPKRSAAETAKQLQAYQDAIFAGELEINELYRERARQQALMNTLKLQGLRDEKKLLEEQKKQIQEQYDLVLAQLQKENAIIDKTAEKYGGIFGIGRRTRAKDITESLAGKNFEQLEELFLKGQLEGKAKTLFEQLQRLRQEGADIDKMLADNAEAFKEAITGTTSDSITNAILEGFKNGKHGAADFADDFERLMQDAVLQALKYEALEEPLRAFYEQFADRADSDGILTDEEIRILRENFNSIINDAGKKFDELQQITNIDLAGSSGGSGNSLAGAIKGITQQQADLLAGQFGGLRLTALDHLKVSQTALATLQAIQNHTANLQPMYQLWQRLELNGIKVK